MARAPGPRPDTVVLQVQIAKSKELMKNAKCALCLL